MVATISGLFSVTVEDFNGCISNTDSFDVQLPTDVVVENLTKLNIYPNPTSDRINIEFIAVSSSDYTIRILSSNGSEIFKDIISNYSGDYKNSIDLSTYSKGAYLIEIVDDGNTLYKKLLLQ